MIVQGILPRGACVIPIIGCDLQNNEIIFSAGMPPTRSKGEGGWLGDPFGPQQPYPRPHEARKRVPSDSQVLFIPGLSNDLAEPLAVARQAGVSQQKRELPHDTKLLDLTEKRKRKKGKPTPKASEPTPKPSTRSWEDMLPP